MNPLSKHLDPKAKLPEEEQRTLSCRVPSDLYQRATIKAQKEGLSKTQLIRGLLEFYLESKNEETE